MRALSFLSPDQVRPLGRLPDEAVVGTMPDGATDPADFQTNDVFVALMHDVISDAGPRDPDTIDAARRQRDGFVYVIDLRTPEGSQARVPFHDIIGAFKIEKGTIVVGSYWINDQHRPFTADGLVRLPVTLHQAVVDRLLAGPAAT